MDNNLKEFILTTLKEAFDSINPAMTNYSEFSESLSKEVQVKEGNNIQYNFDLMLDGLIKENLSKFGVTGNIFSEESGFFNNGEEKYRVVYDPFCNSSLASKTFLDAAVGISIFSYDYEFITSAIMDYQTGIIAIVEDEKTKLYQIQNRKELKFERDPKENIEDSWVVITIENQEERKGLSRSMEILEKAKRIIIGSGHIYWLRLVTGVIDVYTDPFRGEPLYEMFASTVAQKSGCIVTNVDGEAFDPSECLKIFEKNKDFVFCPVGTSNEILHKKIIASLK